VQDLVLGVDHSTGAGATETPSSSAIDRDASNVPTISPVDGRHAKTGLPTADVTNQGGFCRLEAVQDPAARGFARGRTYRSL
jgi:hypothetical protein